jgi:hypothetical protein
MNVFRFHAGSQRVIVVLLILKKWLVCDVDPRWCCYTTMDFALAASQNGVSITQQMCHTMILVHNSSMIKDESNKKSIIFGYFLNNIGFLMKGKPVVGNKSVL